MEQSNVFRQAYLHLLLGVSSPEDFLQALRKTGTSEEAVRALIFDVNEEVFRPLHTQAVGQVAPAQAGGTIPQPLVQSTLPTPARGAAPGIEQIVTVPIAQPVAPAARIYDTTPLSATIRTMALDMQAVHEHKEPEAVPYQSTSTPLPSRAPEPVAPPTLARTVAQPPTRTTPATPVSAKTDQPLIKEYSADPYRETI